MISFSEWKNQVTQLGPGDLPESEGTMEDAMLLFFYEGINPSIKDIGYSWSRDDHIIARKFVHLCYMIDTTAKMNNIVTLDTPCPKHRNLEEDRETFDHFVDFSDLLEEWSFRSEIVGTRFDHLIKEFCYVWVDVVAGKPGNYTQRIFDADNEDEIEEEFTTGPDQSMRKKYDLY